MFDLLSLETRCNDGEVFEFLCFWGHRPSKDGEVTKSCLSQWYMAGFTVDGDFYSTAEHWMMAAKARLFCDESALEEVLNAATPREAKAIGRRINGYNEAVWHRNARRIVTEGNLAKFAGNPPLWKFLDGTGDVVIVEASPDDRIWGIGLSASDPRAANPRTWLGRNLLGFVLMDVRQMLRKRDQSISA